MLFSTPWALLKTEMMDMHVFLSFKKNIIILGQAEDQTLQTICSIIKRKIATRDVNIVQV